MFNLPWLSQGSLKSQLFFWVLLRCHLAGSWARAGRDGPVPKAVSVAPGEEGKKSEDPRREWLYHPHCIRSSYLGEGLRCPEEVPIPGIWAINVDQVVGRHVEVVVSERRRKHANLESRKRKVSALMKHQRLPASHRPHVFSLGS